MIDGPFILHALRNGSHLYLIHGVESERGSLDWGDGQISIVDPTLIKSLWGNGSLLMTRATTDRFGTTYELSLPAWIAQ
jgi:hypothetical protein